MPQLLDGLLLGEDLVDLGSVPERLRVHKLDRHPLLGLLVHPQEDRPETTLPYFLDNVIFRVEGLGVPVLACDERSEEYRRRRRCGPRP